MDNSKIHQRLVDNFEKKVLCSYQNLSDTWQIIKITNISDRYLEKVVLPGQKILFQGSIKAKLKVFSAENITAVLIDTIPCHKLIAN